MNIRKANLHDLSRVAEIYVFNNRMNYLPIFNDEKFSFNELQVVSLVENYFQKDEVYYHLYVYDDGIIKGFLQLYEMEIVKLYVEPFFQSVGIGSELLEYAWKQYHANHLWALEKNTKAISFYQRHGFCLSGMKKFEEDTPEFLVELKRES